MSLYLCVFDDNADIAGVDVGGYADFGALRDYIVSELEGGKRGSRFPTFILHSDSDGEWSVTDCETLRRELAEIGSSLRALPPKDFDSEWQRSVAKSIGLKAKSAFESFIDVDGEFLLERLQALIETALSRRLPILFQ
jgi:hypothetical protein